jgi:hypothetical protein
MYEQNVGLWQEDESFHRAVGSPEIDRARLLIHFTETKARRPLSRSVGRVAAASINRLNSTSALARAGE